MEKKQHDASSGTAESMLYEFLSDLAAEKEYRFSSPWRPKGSLAVVVPIIARSVPSTKREYVMLQESDKIGLKDTGDIGRVSVTNKGDLPVFVRLGSIFKGDGTQTRSANKSIFIEPGETLEVNVNCVHASHPIDRTASFASEKVHVTPAEVEYGLYNGLQQEVWDRVRHYSTMRSRMARRERRPEGEVDPARLMESDNMTGSLYSSDAFSEMINRLLKEVPEHEGQVGMAVIDQDGVYGLEMFDSPDSWKALGKGIVAKYGERLAGHVKEGGGVIDVKVNLDKVHDAIRSFLARLGQSSAKITFSPAGKQDSIRAHIAAAGNDIHGEAIFRSTRFVHFTASRSDQRDGLGIADSSRGGDGNRVDFIM